VHPAAEWQQNFGKWQGNGSRIGGSTIPLHQWRKIRRDFGAKMA
jgi:hypothetical protein